MPTSPTVPSGTTAEVLGPAQVSKLLDIIADILEDFEQRLQEGIPSYMHKWYRFVHKASFDLRKQGSGWTDTVKRLHGSPDNWHDYVEEVLKLAPPVRPVLKLWKKETGEIYLLRHNITDSIYDAQMTSHLATDLQSSISAKMDSIPTKMDSMMATIRNMRIDPCPSSDDEEIPVTLEKSTPVICRFAKTLSLKKDPSTGTKSEPSQKSKEPSPEYEEAYHDPKGPADDDPRDQERNALLNEGLDDEEIDTLFQEDEITASYKDEPTPNQEDHNTETPHGTYGGAFYDSGYHDGYKEGIADIAYDDGYNIGYDNGFYDHEQHEGYPSDYYSDYSYDDNSYHEAPD